MSDASDLSSEEERSLFRPFTRESLATIETRIAEEHAKQKELEKKRAEGEVHNTSTIFRALIFHFTYQNFNPSQNRLDIYNNILKTSFTSFLSNFSLHIENYISRLHHYWWFWNILKSSLMYSYSIHYYIILCTYLFCIYFPRTLMYVKQCLEACMTLMYLYC